jgi:hypothetical protein
VIVAIASWGCFVRVVVVVVVNVDVVMGVGISANVTDVTVPSRSRADVAGPYSAGIEASH